MPTLSKFSVLFKIADCLIMVILKITPSSYEVLHTLFLSSSSKIHNTIDITTTSTATSITSSTTTIRDIAASITHTITPTALVGK